MDNRKPSTEPKKKSIIKRVLKAVILLLILAVIIEVVGGFLYEKYENTKLTITSTEQTGLIHSPLKAKAKDTNIKVAINLGDDIEALIAQQSTLPERSPLGLGLLGKSQESTSTAINELTESLSIELGSSRSLGSIRTLTKLRDETRELEELTQSADPEIKEASQKKLTKNQKQQEELLKDISQNFAKEGLPLTPEQVRSLCMSPNAEDTTSLISAFSSLKAISLEMESRLRNYPTQANAQKYYGTHCVMLLALDRIQKHVCEAIVTNHIPKAEEIAFEAKFRKEEAHQLLGNPQNEMPSSERNALLANQESCKTTEALAIRTQEKLKENLEIILQANQKLQVSISTAKNSHATAMLQKEILQIAKNHSEEIAQIQRLTIPTLAAINFADPTNPLMSPATNGPKL